MIRRELRLPDPVPTTRLPNAPLAEAVFEIHWALVGDPAQPLFQLDPGALPLVHRFTDAMRGIGFGVTQDMAQAHELAGPGIIRRFYREPGQFFPIMQIGPGVYAYNESTEYHWADFKAQALTGFDILLESYPKMDDYPLMVNYAELRYIDIFEPTLVDTTDMIEFMNKVFDWPVGLPAFVENKRGSYADIDGRIQLSAMSKNIESTRFFFDLAKGIRDAKPVFRLEIKVAQTLPEAMKANKHFSRRMNKWLEDAHAITSPFFRSLIRPEIMNKFRG